MTEHAADFTAYGIIYDQERGKDNESNRPLVSLNIRVRNALALALREQGLSLHYEYTVLEDDDSIEEFARLNAADLFVLITKELDTDERPRRDVFSLVDIRNPLVALLSWSESTPESQRMWLQDFGQWTAIWNRTRGTPLMYADFVKVAEVEELLNGEQKATTFGKSLITNARRVKRLIAS